MQLQTENADKGDLIETLHSPKSMHNIFGPPVFSQPATNADRGPEGRVSTPIDHPSVPLGLQYDIRKLELQAEAREHDREREAEARERDREREHQLTLRRLELESRHVDSDNIAQRQSAFRVETAVKLIPKFNEHDIESFLISFEKIAQLNNFPEDKYAAVLQAHLTGKALKVFTELSVAECQHYPTLKAALLAAYSVVPEVYRKRFRCLNKSHSKTYSEFAFRLSTQFKRWLESEEAYPNINALRELFQLEQFNTGLDSDNRSWLLDQKPKTLSQAARLADQYVAVHKADRFSHKSFDSRSKPFRGVHNGIASHKPPNPQYETNESRKSNEAATKSKLNEPRFPDSNKVVCYYCKKPGHMLALFAVNDWLS